MAARNRISNRMTGLFVRWGLIEHPYGYEYARDHYTLSGRWVPTSSPRRGAPTAATEAVLTASVLLVLALLTTSVLFA